MSITISYYDNNALSYSRSTFYSDMDEIYPYFQKYLRYNSNILDVGCGSGRDIVYFSKCGYYVEGLDASTEMCVIASKNTASKIYNMKIEDINLPQKYDAIWACASLLHIESIRLSSVIIRLIDQLNSKGILYMSFKHGEFEGYIEGRYFNNMTEIKLFKILSNINYLEILEIFYSNDERDVAWMNILLRKN